MMHKSYSIVILGVILFYLLRPLLPYFDYLINKDYIAENLCVQKDIPDNDCQGKCHLHDELRKQSGNTDNNTNDKEKIIPENKMDDHLQASSLYSGFFPNKTILPVIITDLKAELFITKIFRPPRY